MARLGMSLFDLIAHDPVCLAASIMIVTGFVGYFILDILEVQNDSLSNDDNGD